jgi:integrase
MTTAAPKILASPFPARRRKKPISVRYGSVTLKIYPTTWTDPQRQRTYRSHTIIWNDGVRRRREKRSTLELAYQRAEKIAEDIATGKTTAAEFSPEDLACYRRCLEIAAAADAPLELLVSEAVAARKKSAHAHLIHKTCPALVAELLERKRAEGKCGAKWLRILGLMLDRLAQFWPGPVHDLRAPDLNRWLRQLKGGLVYRRHHRAAAVELINFGKTVDALPRDWDEWALVEDPEPPPVRIKIWTPAYLTRLLARTHANMIPFTVCQAFAGIRHEELNPEECEVDKLPLDWRHFDWEQKHIEITEEVGKTGARIVPLSDNLITWLKPHRKESGPVCTVRNTSNALARAKKRAGLPAGKNESRNVLRKSFGSYRLAVVKHIGQVADEMGNSPAKIKSNYRKPRPEREGKAWFDIRPTDGEIRQMRLAGV